MAKEMPKAYMPDSAGPRKRATKMKAIEADTRPIRAAIKEKAELRRSRYVSLTVNGLAPYGDGFCGSPSGWRLPRPTWKKYISTKTKRGVMTLHV